MNNKTAKRSTLPISIILSVYNAEKYLKEAIESILIQTFKGYEFIIINDGSSDGSLKIIKEYAKLDNRIKVISRENKGLIYSLNEGIDIAQGKYIARMDADDISMPNRLIEQYKCMEANKEIVVCGSWIKHFGEKSNIRRYPIDDDDIRVHFVFRSPFAHPSVLIRTEAIKDIKYNFAYKHAEDYKLWSEMMNYGKMYNIPKVLLKYRITSEQITSKYGDESTKVSRQIRREYINNFFKEENINNFVPKKITLKDIQSLDMIISKNKKMMNSIRQSYYLSLEEYSVKSLVNFIRSFDYIKYPYTIKIFIKIIYFHIVSKKDKWL